MIHASTLLRESLPDPAPSAPRIAVLIPCYNEEMSIGRVVSGFRAALPAALVYVYDNNSRDSTASSARGAGAIVRREPLQGKGHVVRRMFADIDADAYVMADGDLTYDPGSAPAMVEQLFAEQLDMVVGTRRHEAKSAYRWGHRWGNTALTSFVSAAFGRRFEDMLSGYKVFSRRFVKSFPALSSGFEIETELTVHALQLDMPVDELPTRYKDRADGSTSKLNTWRDGWRILVTIMLLIKEERPLAFFGAVCAALTATSLVLARPVVATWLETGLVPRLPTALLATGLVILGFLSLACGLILDSVARGRREMRRLHYLAQDPPGR